MLQGIPKIEGKLEILHSSDLFLSKNLFALGKSYTLRKECIIQYDINIQSIRVTSHEHHAVLNLRTLECLLNGLMKFNALSPKRKHTSSSRSSVKQAEGSYLYECLMFTLCSGKAFFYWSYVGVRSRLVHGHACTLYISLNKGGYYMSICFSSIQIWHQPILQR